MNSVCDGLCATDVVMGVVKGSGIGVTTGVTARVCDRCDGIIGEVGNVFVAERMRRLVKEEVRSCGEGNASVCVILVQNSAEILRIFADHYG